MKLRNLFAVVITAVFALVACEQKKDNGPAVISVNPESLSFEQAVGEKTVTVVSNYKWEARTDADWIFVDPASGEATGGTEVKIIVLENTGHNREDVVNFYGNNSLFCWAILEVAQTGPEGEEGPGGNYGPAAGSGTKDDPYNVARAYQLTSALSSEEKLENVYVKGRVNKIKEIDTGNYGNATYWIVDADFAGDFYVYRSKNLGNGKFTSEDQLKVGDEVVIYGTLVNFGGTTPEFTQGSYLYSINGKTGGDPTPSGQYGPVAGSGTQTDPYNVAKAQQLASALSSEGKVENVYVKGKVSKIKEIDTGSYGNATYWIVDENYSGDFEVYRGKYLNNEKFTSADQLKVGDEVVVFGTLINFQGNTPEFTQGNYLYSINGNSSGGGGTPTPAEKMDLAGVLAAEEGKLVTTENVFVGAVTTKGYVATDGTNSVYVYHNSTPTVNVGDIVTFTATRSAYYGLPEMTSPTTTKTGTGAVTYPNPVDITANFDSYTATTAVYVKYTATMVKSGNYTNFKVEGATLQGALSSAPEYSGVSEGDKVTIYGYFNGINTSNKLLNVIAVKIENQTTGKTIEIKGSDNGGGGGNSGGGETGSATIEKQSDGSNKISWAGQSAWGGIGGDVISTAAGNYTITVSKQGGTTKPTVNSSYNDCRAYAGNTVTIANSADNITSVVFVISSQGKKRLTDITADTGNVKVDTENWTVTWTGSAKSVTLTVGAKATYGTDGSDKAGQFDFDYISVKP